MAFAMPMPWPRKTPRMPNFLLSRTTSLIAAVTPMALPLMDEVCMITSRRDRGLVTAT